MQDYGLCQLAQQPAARYAHGTMDFAEVVTAIDRRVQAEYRDATATIGADLASWARDGYVAFIADPHDGSFLLRFEIDGDVDDLSSIDQNDPTVIETTIEVVLLVMRFSRTKHFLGTNLGDDPAVKSYGDGWSYTDADGRQVFGGRFIGPYGFDAGRATTVRDDATGQNAIDLADYIADPRPTNQHKEEADDVTQLLVAASQLPATLAIEDKPDVHADLYGLGKFVYIEHARTVIRPVLELAVAVDRLNEELSAVRVPDATIRIGIAHDGVRPKLAAAHRELLDVVKNVGKLVRNQRTAFDTTYPELHRISAVYVVRDVKGEGGLHVQVTAGYDDARILADQERRAQSLSLSSRRELEFWRACGSPRSGSSSPPRDTQHVREGPRFRAAAAAGASHQLVGTTPSN